MNKTKVQRVSVIKGEAFELDPAKKYLVILKSDRIDPDKVLKIGQALKREFGNTFTLMLPPTTGVEIIEADPANAPQEENKNENLES